MNENGTESNFYKDFTFGINVSMLVVCWFGFYGNIVSLLIFTKKSMRSSINVLLTGLSVIDTFLLLTSLPVYSIPNLLDYYSIDNKYYNAVYMLFLYPVSMVAQTCSIWTFVIISVERYVAVCRPFTANKFVTVGRAKFAQICVVVTALLYNLIRFWEYTLKMDGSPVEDDDQEFYAPLLRTNRIYFSVYYSTMYLVTNLLFPLSIIVILNTFIVRTLRAHDTVRSALSSSRLWHRNTSTMVVVVTALFLVFNTPTFVISLWEWINPNLFSPDNDWVNVGYLLIDTTNIFVMVNSSINFIIYYIYCGHYRYYFWNLNRKLCRIPKQSSSDMLIACRRVSLITQISKTNVKTSVVEMSQFRQPPARRMAISATVG